MFQRICNPPIKHSFFLFGARGTGKTSLLKSQFRDQKTLWIDLLQHNISDRYIRDPDSLYDQCRNTSYDWVVIDEVQKAPLILNTIHRLIESKEFPTPHFALTGSSARKLRHGGANLLAGRAFIRNLYPLTHRELGSSFNLDEVLNYGSLPKIFQLSDSESRHDFLSSYALSYLNEEIWAEHLIQNLDPFRKFIEIAAQSNGTVLNFAKIARDVHANEKTVKKYFQILEDTLVGFFLEPFHNSLRKRQNKSSKFYLFDLGVKRALERSLSQKIIPHTYSYGTSFEHFVIAEAMRLNDYGRKDFRFSYFLTKDGGEIDLIVERPGAPIALIEIKSKTKTDEHDTSYMRSVMRDFGKCDAYCLSLDTMSRSKDGIDYLPWQLGLQEIGL